MSGGPVVVRSGVTLLFFWMGLALGVVGLVMGVVFLVGGLREDDGSLVATAAGSVAVFGGGGTLMHLAGRRMRVEVGPDGLRWWSLFGGAEEAEWRWVRQVFVPERPRDGRHVFLLMRDGQRRPVRALGMSSGEGRNLSSGGVHYPDGAYRAAGARLVEAHKEWLARQNPWR